MDVAKIGVVLGFRTGKCILYDLEDGIQKVTYFPGQEILSLSSVTHVTSTSDDQLIVAQS